MPARPYITDLSIFPSTWNVTWVRLARDLVDVQRLGLDAEWQFVRDLSANAVVSHHASRARELAYAEGHREPHLEAQVPFIRLGLLLGKLTPLEIADMLDVPLAAVVAQQQLLPQPA